MELISSTYGVSKTFDLPFVTYGATDYLIGVTLATGDVKISKDGAAFTNIATLPIVNGAWMKIVLSATEMQASRISVQIIDQTATKVFEDTAAILNTDNIDVNIVEISGDSAAADNLESQYDTTGLTGGTFPGTQDQLSGLANVGSAINRPAASYTLTTGTQSANTYTATEALDGTNHEHTDDGGVLDLYYEFNIGAGFASSVQVTGYVQGNNDDIDVYGYDWVAAAWVQIGTMEGKAQAINDVNSFNMFVDMVGNGANQGIVRVRFYKASGLTSATLAIDQIFTSFNQTAEGYQNSAVWVNTNASNTNTVKGIDGTATNPVSTMAAANTLLASNNLSRLEFISGSSVTLGAAQTNQVLNGLNWTLALGGQDIAGTTFNGAHVSGIATGTGTEQNFNHCHLDNVTHIKGTHVQESGIGGTQTAGEAGDYHFDRCHSSIAGTATWAFDFGAAIGDTNLNWRNGSGGIQLENMGDTGIDTASIEGRGQVIEGTCTGGNVSVRGLFTTSGITNLALSDGARYERSAQVDANWNAILTSATYNINKSAGKRLRELLEDAGYEGGFIYYDSTGGGSAGDEPFENGTLENSVDNMTDLNALLTALPFCCIKVTSGSTITLAASQEIQVFTGEIWTLELGGQSISGSTFHGANISGTATGAIKPKFEDCNIGNVTVPPCHMDTCGIEGPITAGSAGDFFIADNCHSAVAGVGAPVIDFAPAVGDVGFNMRWYSGGLDLRNMGQTGTDMISIEGNGQVIINENCIGGTIAIRGHQTLTGRVAFIAAGGIILDDARFAVDQVPPATVVAGGGTAEPAYAEENERTEIVQGDNVSIFRYLAGNHSEKTIFFGAKTESGATAYAVGVIQCTNISYDAETDKTSYAIPFVTSDTENTNADIYKGETEIRDIDGISNPVTGDRYDFEVIGQIIVPA